MKNRYSFLLYLLLYPCMFAAAQNTSVVLNDSLRIKAIGLARHYASDSLHLQTGENFYTWQTDSLTGHFNIARITDMYCYVYAYDPKTKKSPLEGAFQYFGNSEKNAQHYADSLQKKGYETLLYKTAGTSAAQLNQRLLEYDLFSLRYIILHEAVHRHRGNSGSELPYIFEEALCDVVADYGVPKITDNQTENIADLLTYMFTNNALHQCIREAIVGKTSAKTCDKQVKLLLKDADAFQKDRFGYPVNQAYLERYTSYCKYYFVLKQALAKSGNIHTFLDKVFALKGSEQEVAEALQKMAGE